MNIDALYGDRYHVPFLAEDGWLYRVRLRLHGYTGAVHELPLHGRAACRARWGVEGGPSTPADCLRAFRPFTLDLTVLPRKRGALGYLVGQPDGFLMAILESADDPDAPTAWEEIGRGFLVQERMVDVPSEWLGPVRLRFHDGWRYLNQKRPFAGEETGFELIPERVRDSLIRCLGPLGGQFDAGEPAQGWAGLKTSTGWRPWLPGTEILASEDPLARIRTRPGAWLDDDGASEDMGVAVRSLAARFGAVLFLSGGYWRLVQRDLLAADPTAVPTWTYPGSGTLAPYGISAAGTRTEEDHVVDTAGWDEVAGPERELTLPVRSVESAYHFRPPLDGAVLNPSFEAAGATADDAQYWDAVGWNGGGHRVLLDSSIGGQFPSYANRYGFKVFGYGPANDVTHIVQHDKFFVPATVGWRVDLRYVQTWVASAPGNVTLKPRARLFVGYGYGSGFEDGHYLQEEDGTAEAPCLHGEGVRAFVSEIAAGIPGAVPGTVIIPKGTPVNFYRYIDPPGRWFHVATLTLDQAARVGDVALRGDLEGDLERDDAFHYYTWSRAGAVDFQPLGTFDLDGTAGAFGTYRAAASGTAPDGEAIAGYVALRLYGPLISNNGQGATNFTVYDEVDLTFAFGGGGEREIRAAVVSRAAGRPGILESLPAEGSATRGRGEHPIGDGPMVESETGLVVGAAPAWTTYQFADTGWKAGAYGVGEASTGVGLEEHAATRTMLQIAGPLERVRATFLLDAAAGVAATGTPQRLMPEHVARYWQDAVLAEPAPPGVDSVLLTAPVRPGQQIRLSVRTEREETVTVDELETGTGSYTARLAAPTTQQHYRGALCRYSLLVWPDTLEWVVDEGAVTIDATELRLATEIEGTLITELRLGRVDDA